MKIDILTLFPEMFEGPFRESILRRAQDKLLVKIKTHNLRDWAIDSRGTVDDRPYGGGVGMVLMVEPLEKALKTLRQKNTKVILLTPQGRVFSQKVAQKLVKISHLIFICGHYEGVDERVSENLVDEEISIGDFVLTGGEIPAMVIVDTVVRLLPGVLKKEEAVKFESFSQKLLEYPQYTRPENYQSFKVPKILLSGNHKEIAQWREKEALKKTKKRRPDLLK